MSRVIKGESVAFNPHPLPVAVPAPAPPAPSEEEERAARVRAGVLERGRILQAAREEARAIIERAEAIAAARLEEVEIERERLEELVREEKERGFAEGYAEGSAKGFEGGRNEALESARTLLAETQKILDAAREAQQKLLDEARDDLLALAVAVAEKILRRELARDGAALAILKELLPEAEGAVRALVRVSPATYASLDGPERDLLERALDGCRIEIVPDRTLDACDVTIETDWGLIDGRLRSRWRRVLEGLDLLGGAGDASV